jgi:hypothetical protein
MRSGLVRRVGPALAAFVLVAVGVLVLAGGGQDRATAEPDVMRPTLVAVGPIEAGASVDALGSRTEVRMLPADARAEGSVESLAQLPAGVLAAAHVAGQQVLATSVVEDVRGRLGRGMVAVSATLDPAQWSGPVTTTGTRVNVYAIGAQSAELIAVGAVVLNAPDPSTLAPQQESVVTLGVPDAQVPRVIGAVAGAGIWLVTA